MDGLIARSGTLPDNPWMDRIERKQKEGDVLTIKTHLT